MHAAADGILARPWNAYGRLESLAEPTLHAKPERVGELRPAAD